MSNPAIRLVKVKDQQAPMAYECPCGATELTWSHMRQRKGHHYVVFVCRECWKTEVEQEIGTLYH